ncbi:MAG: FAD-binding oxidoreductase, partial [Candidatus Asgardarchaeia archaeon]
GGKLVKDNISASKLMHLFIGTEGILGVITKAVIRLSPKYKATATMIVPFGDRHSALNTVPKVLQRGIIPLGLEYVEKGL